MGFVPPVAGCSTCSKVQYDNYLTVLIKYFDPNCTLVYVLLEKITRTLYSAFSSKYYCGGSGKKVLMEVIIYLNNMDESSY